MSFRREPVAAQLWETVAVFPLQTQRVLTLVKMETTLGTSAVRLFFPLFSQISCKEPSGGQLTAEKLDGVMGKFTAG